MSRRSSRKYKKNTSEGKKIIMPTDDIITSDNEKDLSPTTTISCYNRDMKMDLNTDSTDAPQIGEEEEDKEQYAKNTAELIDKRVFSGKGIPFIVILIIMGLIFVQDNYAKSLNNWKDIWWSIQKCSFFLILYVIFLLYQLISKHWKKKKIRR